MVLLHPAKTRKDGPRGMTQPSTTLTRKNDKRNYFYSSCWNFSAAGDTPWYRRLVTRQLQRLQIFTQRTQANWCESGLFLYDLNTLPQQCFNWVFIVRQIRCLIKGQWLWGIPSIGWLNQDFMCKSSQECINMVDWWISGGDDDVRRCGNGKFF